MVKAGLWKGLLDDQVWEKRQNGRWCLYWFQIAREHKDVLPLDFILGFYVTQASWRKECDVFKRDWQETDPQKLKKKNKFDISEETEENLPKKIWYVKETE